jgi:DNA-binding transcriptional LysR family regulator
MVNIPTDLLRTLIAVVDLRSFTRAAQSLGVTQPAVSAQIKRLQFLLGTDLLDKSAPGVSLTSDGELVVKYVRQLLAINDHIVDLASPRPSRQTMRIGMAGDFPAAPISLATAQFCKNHPDVSFVLTTATLDKLLRDLREGALDIVVGLSPAKPVDGPRHYWAEDLVWVGSRMTTVDLDAALPVVTYGEACIFHQVALTAAQRAQRNLNLVYVGPSISGIAAGVREGLGITVLPRRRVSDFPDLCICDQADLPPLPEVTCGVYARDGAGDDMRQRMADVIADCLAPDRAPASVPAPFRASLGARQHAT